MSKFKKNLLIFLIITISITFTGCWNYREISEMAIVTSLAIDKDFHSNKYIVSVEVIHVSHGERGGNINSKIFESQGNTLFEAVRDLINVLGRKAYWSHCKIVIISKRIAESDISPVLDWLFRDQELRRDMDILISKSPSAADVLKLTPALDDIIGLNINATLRNQRNNNRFSKAELGDVASNFAKEEKDILIPLVGSQKEVSDEAIIEGSAILRREAIIGYLSGEDTFNALWLQGKVKAGTFVIKNLVKPNVDATIEIFKSKTKTKFISSNNKKQIIVNIHADVGLAELSDKVPFQQAKDQEKIREGIEKAIEERLTNTIKKVQTENKTDVFNFYDKARIYDKKYYKKVSSNWGEEFANIPVTVNADIYIRGSAMASTQIKGGK